MKIKKTKLLCEYCEEEVEVEDTVETVVCAMCVIKLVGAIKIDGKP